MIPWIVGYFAFGYFYYLWFWKRSSGGLEVQHLFWGIWWSWWVPLLVCLDVGELIYNNFELVWHKRIL